MPGFRNKLPVILLTLSILLTNMGCKDIYDQDKYKRPEWLAGKLFSQLSVIESLSTFTRCVEISGYDTILDRTGSFTIFAPDNAAFTAWLSEHPEYAGSVENIPLNELRELVKIHIIQDAWTRDQFQTLDVGGWIDVNDPSNNKPRAYKRQSLLKESNTKYWIYNNKGHIEIVDSTHANEYRLVYTRSRKYVPIFFSDYFSLYDLTSADYEYYYDRPFDYGSIHYANSKVLSSEVFAENGFIYAVDQVVNPIQNIEQVLQTDPLGKGYRYMIELMWLFPNFSLDLAETNKQSEAKAGLSFDSLFILNYPKLPFDAHDELTGPNTNSDIYTLRYHNGFLAPDDNAFQKFIDEVITGPSHWNSWESLPVEVKKIVLNNHMTASPIYQSDLQKGFYSGEDDLIHLDESVIDHRYYGSNSTFLGLNEVIIPRAMTSVSGPVYLRPGFSTLLYAMEYSKVLPAIKIADADYSFFILDDNTFYEDSSLFIKWKDRDKNIYEFESYDRSAEKFQKIASKLLSKRILNQVGTSTPTGYANKEFIENLAGNYIVFENSTNIVKGGGTSTAGYNGGPVITVTADELNESADNGNVYEVNGWLVPPKNDMYTALSSRTRFLELLETAGLYDSKTYSFNFLTEGEYYTIFVPSDQAFDDFGVDTLAADELENLLKYHFVKGAKIFTDGKMPHGDYETIRVDESSTPLFKRFSIMTIQPGPDLIHIYDQSDNLLGSIYEAEDLTNVMITTETDEESTSEFYNITSSILHDIDFVIHK